MAVREAEALAIHKRLLGPDATYDDLAALTSKNVDRTMEKLGLEVAEPQLNALETGLAMWVADLPLCEACGAPALVREGGRWQRVTGTCPRVRGRTACGGLYSIPEQPRTYVAWTGAVVLPSAEHDPMGYPVTDAAVTAYCRENGGVYPPLARTLENEGLTEVDFLYTARTMVPGLDAALALLINPTAVAATEARLRTVVRDASVATRNRRTRPPEGPTPVAVAPSPSPPPSPATGPKLSLEEQKRLSGVKMAHRGDDCFTAQDLNLLMRRLLERYPTRNDLAVATMTELGLNLEMVSSGNLTDSAFALIFHWAKPHGRVGQLMDMVGMVVAPPVRELLRELRTFVSRTYPLATDIRRLAQDSGLDLARVDMSGSAEEVWARVLGESLKARKLMALCAAVASEYPHHRVTSTVQFLQLAGDDVYR